MRPPPSATRAPQPIQPFRFPSIGGARHAVPGRTASTAAAGKRPSPSAPRPEVRIRRVGADHVGDMIERVLELEKRVYEPARRDPPERLRLAFEDADGVAIVAEVQEAEGWALGGFVLAAPLERFVELPGPDRDPMRGRHNTIYSISLTVDPDYRGLGIGLALKRAEIEGARAIRREDGSARYRHITGRNRVDRTHAMQHINWTAGAYEVFRLHGQYGDPNAQATYYRAPLGPFVVDAPEPADGGEDAGRVDMASGLSRPFAHAPESLRRALDRGLLYGPAVHKITLCNYVTPGVVRAIEHVGALSPRLPHVYLTSSRDETFDKTVRALRLHRPGGQVVLGLEGGYVGHTTAAARSLSDPTVHAQGLGYFEGWERLPHPAEAGSGPTLDALRDAVQRAGGPDGVLGLFLEPVQERTGRVVPDVFWERLAAMREELGLKVVLAETATASYRSGRGPFFSTGGGFVPDAMIWWGGGQIGFVHVADELFVPTPLTLVSTWDGDELSLVRVHHQLRAASRLDLSEQTEALEHALEPATRAGMDVRGVGLYRVIDAGGRAAAIEGALAAHGFRVRRFANHHVAVVPSLDVSLEALERFRAALKEVCR